MLLALKEVSIIMRKTSIIVTLAIFGWMIAPANAQLLSEDFESGLASWTHVTAGWGSNYESIIASPGASGAGNALRNGWANGSGNGSQARLRDIVIPAGVNSIDLSLKWKNIKGGSNGWYEVLLLNNAADWDGPSASELLAKEEYGFGSDTVNSTWHDLVVNSIAVTPGATYTIGLKTGGNPADGNQGWFDDLVVTPEPTSLALLGVAGLPLLFRRRRA
jgi:hypothetical protein